MKLEELVRKWFIEYKALSERIAVYADMPAIFFQETPDDRQTGWWNGSQYPRIVYSIDMQADQERKSAGTLSLDLFCDEAGIAPEEIEPMIKECLKDLIINPDKSAPYCFAWSRTDSFELSKRESGADTRVVGMEIRFDILEYPNQITTDPDPIVALNRYIKSKIPESFVLGMDNMDSFRVADAKAPIFYCRLEGIEKSRETNTVAWMDGKIAVHVLCADTSMRLKWIMSLANSLSLDGEVVMLDGSPMRVKRLVVNNRADYLKEGQLMVGVYYGLLRYKPQPHLILENNLIYQ